MRTLKATILGMAIVGFTAGSALACGYGKTASVKMTPKPVAKLTLMQPVKQTAGAALVGTALETAKQVTLTTGKTHK